MSTKKQTSDTMRLGILLAIVGGFLDAYTYLCRGQVFANAQTGNIVLLGIRLIEGQFQKALYYFFPIFAFFIGIIIAEIIKHHFLSHPKIHWRQIVLLMEICVLIIVAFLPQGQWDVLCNIMIPFACSLQVESFRKFHGMPYASTMCTGNLRSASEHLYQYRLTKDKKTLSKSLQYYIIIAFFIVGAMLGAILTQSLSIQAVLLPAGLLLIGVLFMFCKQVG